MVQEFVNKEMIVLIPKSDAEKIENGELSLYPPQLRKKGKIIRHLDTLDSNDNFYAKNPVIQISNQYIFAESLYSKKLKAKITEVSNQIKKNEKLIEKLIQLQFNDIEAKVIKFNNHLQQNLDNNPLFTNKDVVYVGMDTIPTLTSNFSYLLEDFINSNQITYIQGQKYYYMSILEYNNLKDRRPNIQEIVIHNFSDHIIHFITLSLLNTLNDINLTNFKETGKFLHNWHSDLFNIKEKLIDTVNFLIVGILNYGDIYDICFHKHNNKIFELYNLEKILSLDKRGINIHELLARDYNNTSDPSHRSQQAHPANNTINSNRINSINTIISLIDLCDDIINRLQKLEEMQEENPSFNQLLLDLSEYTITLSESGEN